MSRVYDALQRSQGDNPKNSPLATPPAEAPPIETAIPPAAVPAASALQVEPAQVEDAPPATHQTPATNLQLINPTPTRHRLISPRITKPRRL